MSKRAVLSIGLTLLFICIFGIISLSIIRIKKLFLLPDTYIAHVDVGGLSRKNAKEKLENRVKIVSNRPIKLIYETRHWSVIPSDIMIVHVEESIDEAFDYNIGKGNTDWLLSFLKLKKSVSKIEPIVTFNEYQFAKRYEVLKESIELPPKSAYFNVKGDEISIIKDVDGKTLDPAELKVALISAIIKDETIVSLPVRIVKASKTEDDLKDMSINVKAMEFSTAFDPSLADRTHNIKLAAQAVSGNIISPGEIFSFNETVGERTEEKGYKEAQIFLDNQIVLGLGGGICQLSSTIYNLALLSDLEIVERVSHSLPVDYVPLGRDATINFGSIDFKFKNNSNGFLMLFTEIEGNVLRVKFFGSQKFNSFIRLYPETVRTISPPVNTIPDTSLHSGITKEKPGRPGYEVRLWKIYNDGIKETRQLISSDIYQPIPTIIYKGN